MTEPAAAPPSPEREPAGPARPAGGPSPSPQRWQRFSTASLKAFHAYATWLVSISWWRFIALSLGLLMFVGILHDKPPFMWTVTEQIDEPVSRRTPVPPKPPATPQPGGAQPGTAGKDRSPIRIERPRRGEPTEGVDISIGKDGIRITPRPAASAAQAASAATPASGADGGVHITLPPGATSESVREAVAEARRQIEQAVREAREEAEQAQRDAEEARADAERAIAEATGTRKRTRRTQVGIGDAQMQLTVLWILGSAILKATYKGRMQAERQAARATETAEAESLKRQVVEARMAAMQAQVEPHFLFNTLASIDHLIETDPARASQMQRNLIALLRASMPTMREAGGAGTANGVRDLGRELAVIRPYLEILKVRMEERLATELDVPEGLHSAEFPPMMIQTLVENAIKHGLEPKPEGGKLSVKAQIVHGKLQVVVADTGLGFGKAATAGTGVGLANIRERLLLLYGTKASLTVAENTPSGTVVTVTVPYKTVEGTEA
ncbi:MAG: histidine kinase [Rubrivivax sp.]